MYQAQNLKTSLIILVINPNSQKSQD